MALNISAIILLSCALFATVCRADVSSLRYNRFGRPITSTRLQRQEVGATTPYPAAGYRPDRQFALPSQFFPGQQQPEANLNAGNGVADEESLQRPQLTYGAPARLRQFPARQQLQPQPRMYAAPQQAYAEAQQTFAEPPQQTYGAPDEAPIAAPEPLAERLTALKSARLSDNREDQEDEDDVETNVEVDENVEEKKTVAAAPPAAAATVAYYPAGALNFVQPLSAYVQPGTAYNAAAANYFAKLQVQPAALATYAASAPLTAAAGAPAAVAPVPQVAQFAQPQAFASAYVQPGTAYNAASANYFAKLQVQPAAYAAYAASAPLTAAAGAPAAVAPVPQVAQFAQPQAFASPFFQQQFAYAAPAQLQAW